MAFDLYLDLVPVELHAALVNVVRKLQIRLEESALVAAFIIDLKACVGESLPIVIVGVFAGWNSQDHRGLVTGHAYGLNLVFIRNRKGEVRGEWLAGLQIVVGVITAITATIVPATVIPVLPPVRWRLTIFNALVIGGILVVLGLALFFLLRETLFSSVEETTRNRAFAAAEAVASGKAFEEEDGRLVIDETDMENLSLDGVFIIVRDGQGNVIAQTVNLPARNEARDPVWRLALETGKPAYGAVRLSGEEPDYVYAVPVSSDGPSRIVEAGKSYAPAAANVRTIGWVLAGGIVVAFLLSSVGAYLLARAALSPVGAVVRSAREITEGDLSKRLPVAHPSDEIGRLATTMNDMLSRLEEAFARREETLVRQRRFAADASHELRTPLTSIGGYARMLEDWGLEDTATAREGVAAINRESGRMLTLVESLLALTRGDEGMKLKLERNDLTEVAREAAESAWVAANGKVDIECAAPDGAASAVFDRERVRQAVSILLDNAVKYSPEGGRVRVGIREAGGRAEVRVSDTGPGIPEDELPLIFERFYRADKARASGGAGLGLSIAQQVVNAHGGEIQAHSEPGEGSTFVISIPRASVPGVPTADTPRTRAGPATPRRPL